MMISRNKNRGMVEVRDLDTAELLGFMGRFNTEAKMFDIPILPNISTYPYAADDNSDKAAVGDVVTVRVEELSVHMGYRGSVQVLTYFMKKKEFDKLLGATGEYSAERSPFDARIDWFQQVPNRKDANTIRLVWMEAVNIISDMRAAMIEGKL